MKTQNNFKKRPSVDLNHFPENQSVFSKKRAVAGEDSYRVVVEIKTNSKISKYFSILKSLHIPRYYILV